MRFFSRRQTGVAVTGRMSRLRAVQALRHASFVESLERRQLLAADLAVTKVLLPVTGAPAPVTAGAVVAGVNATYRITVRNNGPDDALNVLLTDVVPTFTTFVSFVQESGPVFAVAPNPFRPLPGVGGSGPVDAGITTLQPLQEAQFLFTVQVAANTPDISQVINSATVDEAIPNDPNRANNLDTVISEVEIQTDIQVVSAPDKINKLFEGTYFPYSFSIINRGPSDAQNVTFRWTTPNFNGPFPAVGGGGGSIGGPGSQYTYVFDRYPGAAGGGPSFQLVTGPAFNVTLPPRPPNGFPLGNYNGTLMTLPAGVGSTYQFFVGTPQQQDFVQVSSGGTSSPDVNTLNDTYTDTTHVYDAPLVVQQVQNIQGNAAQPLDIELMRYIDTNSWPGNGGAVIITYPTPSGAGRYNESFDFNAMVTWGDGSAPELATISTDGTGRYHVTGEHTYAAVGSYPVTILVTGDGESTALGNTVALIGNAARGGAQVGGLEFTENVTETKRVAVFARGNAATSTTFTAQITWGDGSTATAGTVTSNGVGTFDIGGTHKYANEGTYTGNVRVTGSDGVVTNIPMVVLVKDRSVVGVPVNVAAQAGVQATNVAVATFTDPGGPDPVNTYVADIDWGDGSGASAGFITYNSTTGVFTVRGTHTYAATGMFPITVTVSRGPTIVNPAPATIITPTATVTAAPPAAPVVASPVNVVAPLNVSTTVPVATFTDPSGDTVVGNFAATIDWGDGTTPTAGVISLGSGGTFTVTGTHTFTTLGTFNMSVSITHAGSAGVTVTPTATVINPAPAVNATGVAVSAVTNVPLTGVLVATFKDPNGPGALTNYTATIDWGDGTTATPGVITYASATQTFSVRGDHTFATAGTYNMSVRITRTGSLPAVVTPVATVRDPSNVTVTGTTVSGVEGKLLTNVTVGNFTTTNLAATIADFAAVITWGDGTATSVGTIVKTGAGMFVVRGTHTYKDDGKYNISVALTPVGQPVSTIPSIANITDAQLSGVKVTFAATKNVQFTNKIVGSFSDANPFDLNAGEYAVTIAWGDATATSTGSLTYNASTKRWDIKGSHKYLKASPTGGFVLTITVKDGTQQIKINSIANVT
jgi:uncharacterized repeat protein (TIGR01451 family)